MKTKPYKLPPCVFCTIGLNCYLVAVTVNKLATPVENNDEVDLPLMANKQETTLNADVPVND